MPRWVSERPSAPASVPGAGARPSRLSEFDAVVLPAYDPAAKLFEVLIRELGLLRTRLVVGGGLLVQVLRVLRVRDWRSSTCGKKGAFISPGRRRAGWGPTSNRPDTKPGRGCAAWNASTRAGHARASGAGRPAAGGAAAAVRPCSRPQRPSAPGSAPGAGARATRPSVLLVQVSHILVTFRERHGRYFLPRPVGRDVATCRRIHASSVDHPARLKRSVICASQVFI